MMKGSYLFEVQGIQNQKNRFLQLLTDFIDLIYEPILGNKNNYDDEDNNQRIIKELTYGVILKNPILLDQVWSQILQLDDQQQIKCTSVMKIFNQVFKDPLHANNLQFFTFLMKTMAGKNGAEHAKDVFKFLQKYMIPNQNRGGQNMKFSGQKEEQQENLMDELLCYWIILLNKFLPNQQQVNQEQFDQLSNLIVIFSKIIKQQNETFYYINSSVESIVHKSQAFQQFINNRMYGEDEQDIPKLYLIELLSDESKDMGIEQILLWQNFQNDGIQFTLRLLMQSLFAMISLKSPEATQDTVKHLLDAIAKIFNIYTPLKKTIIDLILIFENQYGFKLTNEMLNYFSYEKEGNFKVTSSYLNLIIEVFKLDSPHLLLTLDQQTKINDSLLNEMINIFYTEIVQETQKLSNLHIKQYTKLIRSLFELTYVLLSKFDSGNSPKNRIDAMQPCPFFDPFLNIIFKSLNQINLNFIIQPLELQTIKDTNFGQTRSNLEIVENKFITKIIQHSKRLQSHDEQIKDGDLQVTIVRVKSMIIEGLACLTQLFRLATQVQQTIQQDQQNNYNQMESRGVRLIYASKLQIVSKLIKIVFEPSQQLLLGGEEVTLQKYNLINLVTFYIKADIYLPKQNSLPLINEAFQSIHMNIQATSCLKEITRLFLTQPINQRINLSKLELNTKFFNVQDLETIFISSISGGLTTAANTNNQSQKKPELNILLSRQLIQTFELLTICCKSQKSLMELILNQQLSFNDKSTEKYPIHMFIQSLQYYINSIQGQLGFENLQQFSQKRVIFSIMAFLQVLVSERVAITASPQRSIYHQLLGQYNITQSKQDSPSVFLNYLTNFFIGQICTIQGLKFCDQFDLSFANPIYDCDSLYESMDYYCQQQTDIKIISENSYQLLQLQNYVLNILSISEFLKLIQELYLINTQNNQSVNLIIKQLLTEERFYNFFVINTENLTSELQNCIRQIQKINEQLKINSVENMSDQVVLTENQFRFEMWRNIFEEKIITDQQAQLCSQKFQLSSKPNSSVQLRNQNYHNKTFPEEFSQSPVYIQNLYKQYKQDQSQNLDAILLLQQSEPKLKSVLNDSLFIDECGNLGGNFMISATDIKQAFLSNGLYSRINEINSLISLSITYNLLTSSLFAQNILQESRNNFILSVVDSKYKESKNFLIQQDGFQLEELNQDLLSQALQVFVNENYSLKMEKLSKMLDRKDSQFEKQNQLKKLATIFTKILQKEHQILKKQLKQNIINLNENNLLIDENTKNSLNLLQTILGYLNLCFSSNHQSDDKIHNDMLTLQKWPELKLLAEFLSNEFLQDLILNYQQIKNAFSGNITDNQIRTNPKQLFVFIQLALSSLKILQIANHGEPLDLTNFEDQCAKSIQLCLPKIIDLIGQYWKQTKQTGANKETYNNYDYLFTKYLEVLSVVSKLLSEKSILELFYNDQSHLKPIELVFQRLTTNTSLQISQESLQNQTDNNNQDSEIDIKIEIIHFLILHSEKRCGAAKLYKIGILTELTKLIQLYGLSELHDNAQIGFKSQLQASIHKKHYLWKRILLLIRTIIKQLLPITQPNFIDFKTQEIINSDSFGFLSKIVIFVQKNQIDIIINKYVQQCFPSNVGPSNNLNQLHQTFLEEIDLLTGICSRLMFYEQELCKQSYGMLHGMKDSLLFGMNLLLMNIKIGRNSNIIPTDDKEHTLQLMLTNQILNKNYDNSQIISSSRNLADQSIFRSQTQVFSLFDLKSQILQIQIFMQLNCAIYNLLQKDRELERQNYSQNNGSALFPTNWDYLHERLDNNRYEEFELSYMCKGLGNYLKQLLEKQGQNGVMQLAIYLTKQNYQQMEAIQRTWEQDRDDTTYLINELKKSESDIIEPQILLNKALIVSKEVLRLLEEKNQRTYLQ